MASEAVRKLINRATPLASCFQPSLSKVDDTTTSFGDYSKVPFTKLDTAIAPLLEELLPEASSNPPKVCSYEALNKLYTLSSVKENRVALVCSTQHDVISPLIRILLYEDQDAYEVVDDRDEWTSSDNPPERRKLACLILNNLSIPYENKAILSLGPLANDLLHALTVVMRKDLAESYLCCICLMNITFLEDAVKPVLQYSPSIVAIPKEKEFQKSFEIKRRNKPSMRALSNPHSMLRCIEAILNRCPKKPTEVSIRGETIRWACGFVKNVSNDEENATLIAQTDIPLRLSGYIKLAPLDLVEWTENSLEENALAAMFNLARFDSSKKVLDKIGAADVVAPIIGLGGIHDFRASMIWSSLEDESPDSIRI